MVSFAFAGGLELLGLEELRYKSQFPCLSVLTRELELGLMLFADIPGPRGSASETAKETITFLWLFLS